MRDLRMRDLWGPPTGQFHEEVRPTHCLQVTRHFEYRGAIRSCSNEAQRLKQTL